MTTIDGAIRALERLADGEGIIVTPDVARQLLDYIRGLEAKCAGPQVQGDSFDGKNT